MNALGRWDKTVVIRQAIVSGRLHAKEWMSYRLMWRNAVCRIRGDVPSCIAQRDICALVTTYAESKNAVRKSPYKGLKCGKPTLKGIMLEGQNNKILRRDENRNKIELQAEQPEALWRRALWSWPARWVTDPAVGNTQCDVWGEEIRGRYCS